MKLSLSRKIKESLKMFLVFFKIGLFSFGGGYAMLTMIEHEVVDKRGWLTHDELMEIFAIAESTPGAISINIATFIGTKRAGVIAGVITTLGVVLPAFLVIVALSYILELVRDNRWVAYLFTGVRVGVIVLIVHAAVKFFKSMKKKLLTIALAIAMFCLAVFTEINVIYLMLGTIGISTAAVIISHAAATVRTRRRMTAGVAPYVRTRTEGNTLPWLLACNLLAADEIREPEPQSADEDGAPDGEAPVGKDGNVPPAKGEEEEK